MAEGDVQKSESALREEEVLKFWKENKIFEKSLEKKAPKGEFVFYDGPPFATGLPHTGSMLSSIIKDVIPRYKTMQGYRVRRRWGWDCHGLPIESLIEKKLNLKTKKDILDIGIDTFNEAARASVLEFADEWEKYVDRVGRFVDFKNSYKTMDNSYIESVWWALKKLYEKSLLYEGNKVLMYCPHCETPLAKAEIAMDNTYKDITEEAVTVKFKVKNPDKHGLPENTYLLAWTTTPWTLPGNVALAVGREINYGLVQKDGESLVTAQREAFEGTLIKNLKGSDLVGIEYEPLFDIKPMQTEKSHRVYAADFVSTDEGTGIVHTAVMYGEDDFVLGQKEGLPMVQMLSPSGTYLDIAPEFLRGTYIKAAERDIKRDLETRSLMFKRENHTHSYPHCYRCGTPLIYNAVSSWFINIQKVKEKMLSENEKVTWVPEHLKHGRFKNIVESAPDWTISRNRFWASPLPIWKTKDGKHAMVIGSVEELKKNSERSGNEYFVMRHGEADTNANGTVNSDVDAPIHLTEAGKKAVQEAVRSLSPKPDLIFASPLVRTKETAQIAAKELGIPEGNIVYEDRLKESVFGPSFSGKTLEEWHAAFPDRIDRFDRAPEGGETFTEIQRRIGAFLLELERTHKGKRILIISHGTPIWLLEALARGVSRSGALDMYKNEYPNVSEIRKLDFVPLPWNADFVLDLHRPYTDTIVLVDGEGREYERIPEVVDCWVESGSMPFAEYHYPFENKREFEAHSPGDFIAEYIAQTRTWFYYMHAMGVLLFNRLAFRNVVSTGTILAADGSKMSKSKGNYTDPLLVMDRYGADALRFHLMGSPVMQAEDLNFRDEDVRDTHNRVMGLLWNTYKFFELYKHEYDGKTEAKESAHVLDTWILARLNETVRSVTESLDAYLLPPACRTLRDFVEDYSTWYVRRSRERVKGTEKEDKQAALSTQRHVLLTVAKLLAPISPFIADSVYRGVGGPLESVHLESWPAIQRPSFFVRLFGGGGEAIVQDMATLRKLVSHALLLRDKAGLKVRQPLRKITIGKKHAIQDVRLLDIIKDEVNVKEVVLADIVEPLLDTEITAELREEGIVRDAIRLVQDARKSAKLRAGEHGSISITVPPENRTVVEKSLQAISEKTNTEIVLL